jgi:erythromycin esterase-like protein
MELGAYPAEHITSEIDYIDTGIMECRALSLEDINEDFSNINDLAWLQEIGKAKRAVLVGEDHFNKYIQNLRNRILFALNTYDYYPVIILERPFPYTAFVNHYLQIGDDHEAELFYEKNLTRIVNTREEYDLLHHIRRWNRHHPEKPISAGYYDIEKTKDELSVTLNQILLPTFNSWIPNFILTGK